MDKNIKLFYCLLGSTFLALLKSSLLTPAEAALFEGTGFGASLFGRAVYNITNIVSFTGFVLVIIFSSILIITNINFGKKQ